jgi:hypothetical protein
VLLQPLVLSGAWSPACSAIVQPLRLGIWPISEPTCPPAAIAPPAQARPQQPQQLRPLPPAQPGTYPGGSSRPRSCCRHTRMIAGRLPLSIQIPCSAAGHNPNGRCRNGRENGIRSGRGRAGSKICPAQIQGFQGCRRVARPRLRGTGPAQYLGRRRVRASLPGSWTNARRIIPPPCDQVLTPPGYPSASLARSALCE